MKPGTKKIIAREILLFFGLILLIGATFLISYIYYNWEINRLLTRIEENENQIYSLKEPYKSDIEELWKRLKATTPKFTVPLSMFKDDMADTVNLKRLYTNLGHTSSNFSDYTNKTYRDFAEDLGYSPEVLRKTERLYQENSTLESKIQQIRFNSDNFEWVESISIILILIVYPLRYLYYIIRWSLITLKE